MLIGWNSATRRIYGIQEETLRIGSYPVDAVCFIDIIASACMRYLSWSFLETVKVVQLEIVSW